MLPRHWFAKHAGGTGRTYGADLAIRRTRAGRFALLRRGRVVWRSSGLYRDGADIAFGPHEFAFVSYRRGVFLTDMHGAERLVARGRGLYPNGFTPTGKLIVAGARALSVVSPDGTTLRRYPFRQRNGHAFDERSGALFFVTPGGLLARAYGARMSIVRPLGALDGMMSLASPGLLMFSGRDDVAVTRRDGTLVARASWAGSPLQVFDSGLSASPDGRRFAFRLTNAGPGSRTGRAVVYLLRAGETRARAIYRRRLGPSGCAVGAGLSWHGLFLLYSSSDGRRAILDTRDGGALDLGPLVRALPSLARTEGANAYWASDFREV